MGLARLARVSRNGLSFVRQYGFSRFHAELQYRAVNWWHERQLRIRTDGMVELADVGIFNSEFVEYAPIGYTALKAVLHRVPLDPRQSVFLDYGAGKGRAIAVAATQPFRRVIGVEISEQLAAIARANIARMRHKRAVSVEVVQCDAVQFPVPADANLIYIFNSFTGQTLARVVDNVRASLLSNPRSAYLVAFNKIHLEKLRLDPAYSWIELIDASHVYPNYSCGIYKLNGR